MGKKSDEKLIVEGKRIDGRSAEQAREMEMNAGVIPRSDGSALVKFGSTHAICSVYGPRAVFPRHMEESETGILRCRYNMAPFSVDDRKSPGTDRRSTEISKVTRFSLVPSIFLEDFPKSTIDVFIEILQADGSTRVTGINAASIALAEAGVPMKDLVSACSVGKINDTLVVDLSGKEDNNSEADMAVAMMPNKNAITLLQMDGALTKEEIMTLLGYATETCKKINQRQKEALREKYKKVE